MSLRTERIGEQLRAEIARILAHDATDPRIGLVTLTRVDVAPDLSHALVFWSALDIKGDHPPDEVADGLESAAGFIRRELARRLSLRRIPALRFRRDPSLELGGRTLSLLREVVPEGERAQSPQADGPREGAEEGDNDGQE